MAQKTAVSVLIDEDSVAEEGLRVRGVIVVLQRKIPPPLGGHTPVNITPLPLMHCRNLCQREGLPFTFSDGATFPRLDLCTSIVHIDFQNDFLWPLDAGVNFSERDEGICGGTDDDRRTCCWRTAEHSSGWTLELPLLFFAQC